MPSAGRIRIGIDWLTVLLTAAESIRDMILFVVLAQKNSAAVTAYCLLRTELKGRKLNYENTNPIQNNKSLSHRGQLSNAGLFLGCAKSSCLRLAPCCVPQKRLGRGRGAGNRARPG